MERSSELYKLNDCHIHLGEHSGVYNSYELEDILKLHHDYYLDKILVFSADRNSGVNNFKIQQLVKEYKDFMYGLEWIGDSYEGNPLTGNMLGYKYHGAYNNQLLITFDKELLYLDKHKKLLMIHCGRYLEGGITSMTSWKHAYDIALEFKDIKVIMAHMGGTDTTVCKKAIKACEKLENVYFDTSGITTPYILEYALKLIPSTRILFGSDVPWCSFRAMYYTVMDARISNEDKSNIFHNSFDNLIANLIPINNNKKESSNRISGLSV